MIFVYTIVEAQWRFLHSSFLIATLRALCSVSKACLRAEHGHALIIIVDASILAKGSVEINWAFIHAAKPVAPTLLTACYWHTLVIFIDAVVGALRERDVAF